jgi:RHS repeat-associated protein
VTPLLRNTYSHALNMTQVSYSYNAYSVTETHTRSGTNVTLETRTITKVKDVAGNLAQVVDAYGATVSHSYDAFGNLVKTVDALGNITTLGYDLRGRKVAMQDPNTGFWAYAYNALGELIEQQSPNQRAANPVQSTIMTYDTLGRMVARNEAAYNTTWTYDNYVGGGACAMGKGKLCEVRATGQINRRFTYDALGRPSTQTADMLNASNAVTRTFVTSVAYQAGTGRVESQTWPSGVKVANQYTALGYLAKVVDATTPSRTYWSAGNSNAWSKAENYSYGNGVVTTNNFDAATGRLNNISAGVNGGAGVVNQDYQWDTQTNLTLRIDRIGVGGVQVADSFQYDRLNRLVQYQVSGQFNSGQRTVDLQYNAIGNLLYKTDVGVYTYNASGTARPHAVANVNGVNYSYDANGNMTSASGGEYRNITYNNFNMPDGQSGIVGANGTRYTWNYGEDHQRVYEVRTSSRGTRATYILHPDKANGLSFEQEVAENGTVTNRHYLSAGGMTIGVVTTLGIHTSAGAATITDANIQYWHKDHLGSTIAMTGVGGNVIGRYSYDPFGKRRYITGGYDAFGYINIDFGETGANVGPDRGFTGHEHLDDIGIIHMNGRLYDPQLGRMMQADSVIAGLEDLQYFNRYSYVYNRSLTLTDATGECPVCWAFLIGAAFARATGLIDQQTFRSIVSIAVIPILGPQMAAMTGSNFAAAAISGFVSGAISSGNLKGAFQGMASAMLFHGAGLAATGLGGGEKAMVGTIWANDGIGRAALHAVAGCINAKLSGGNCGRGALSAGASKYLSSNLPGADTKDIGLGTLRSAVIGGTVSVLGGGKFANGAQTAAFQYVFNYVLTRDEVRVQNKADGTIEKKYLYSLRFYDSDGQVVAEQLKDAVIVAGEFVDKIGKYTGIIEKAGDLVEIYQQSIETKDFIRRFGNEIEIARVDRQMSGVASSLKVDLSRVSEDSISSFLRTTDVLVPAFEKLYGFKPSGLMDKLWEKTITPKR